MSDLARKRLFTILLGAAGTFVVLMMIFSSSPEEVAEMNRRAYIPEAPHSIPPCEFSSDCDDNNPCTTNHCMHDWGDGRSCAFSFRWVHNESDCQIVTCDRETGEETTFTVLDGAPCVSDEWDHLDSRCKRGRCVPSSIVVCNDKNPCTVDFYGDYGCATEDAFEGTPCGQDGLCYHGLCHAPYLE